MRFGILGPLRVGDGAGDGGVTAGRDRVVLAMLLLRFNRVVPVDHLVDAVWPLAPPATARGQLHTCVSRLRRALSALGVPPEVIVSDPAGYAIRLGEGDLDASRFENLVEQARQDLAADRLEQASRRLRAAVTLWRGPALAGIVSPLVQRAATALDERHAQVVEDWLDLELRLGRHREVLGDLAELVQRYPLRERLRGLSMLALHRAGRQADALVEYRRVRDLLNEELGIEPGSALRELHHRILTGTETQPAAGAAPSTPLPTVRGLPRQVADFTGRVEVVDRLLRADTDADPLAPVIQVIDGMAGSGKTTLAVSVAHRLADRYPDAQLYIDLHGHSERRPVEPAVALMTLLRQLGVPAERVPTGLEDRVALWRSELAARRSIVLLDNAAGTAQITPLLPAAPGSCALVTSRRRLSGLDGVWPESLGVLTQAEAVEFLARIVGERVHREPQAAVQVVRRCGYLPLAIRLAGARLAHRPRWQLADLLRRLGEPGAVLAGLTAEDRTVAGAFALSYGQLDAPTRRLFQLLGLFPGAQLDPSAAAALAGTAVEVAEDLLDALVDQHLVDEFHTRLFRFHDLIREYARQLAAQLPREEQRRAVVNLLDYYLHAAATVSQPLEQTSVLRRLFRPGPPLRTDLLPEPATDPGAWFDRERSNLDAVSRCAEEWQEHAYTWMIARAGWRLWYSRGGLDELIDAHRRGLAAADRLDDDVAVAMMANYLASGYHRLGRPQEAVPALEVALDRWTRAGRTVAAAAVHGHLCAVYTDLGQFDLAAQHGQAGVSAQRRIQNMVGLCHQLAICGDMEMYRGRFRAALVFQRRSLMLARELGLHDAVLRAIVNVARARIECGDRAPAERQLRVALALRQRRGDLPGVANIFNELAVLHRESGRVDEAIRLHRQALAGAEELGLGRLAELVRRDLSATLSCAGGPRC